MALQRQLDRRTRSEIASIQTRVDRDESSTSWGRVIHLGKVVHLAVVADRLDIAEHAAGEIISIGQRRLRQLGDDAA